MTETDSAAETDAVTEPTVHVTETDAVGSSVAVVAETDSVGSSTAVVTEAVTVVAETDSAPVRSADKAGASAVLADPQAGRRAASAAQELSASATSRLATASDWCPPPSLRDTSYARAWSRRLRSPSSRRYDVTART